MTSPMLTSDCSGCARVRRGADHPLYIATLRESVVFLHEHQVLPGWCVLMLKEHREHLHELPDDTQARLWQDVADAARAIAQATGARRMNYECLGNQLAHIHWHVIPRFEPPTDPDPRNVVWVRPSADLACGVDPDRANDLIWAIRKAGGWERP